LASKPSTRIKMISWSPAQGCQRSNNRATPISGRDRAAWVDRSKLVERGIEAGQHRLRMVSIIGGNRFLRLETNRHHSHGFRGLRSMLHRTRCRNKNPGLETRRCLEPFPVAVPLPKTIIATSSRRFTAAKHGAIFRWKHRRSSGMPGRRRMGTSCLEDDPWRDGVHVLQAPSRRR
jgi:hypothetical protein